MTIKLGIRAMAAAVAGLLAVVLSPAAGNATVGDQWAQYFNEKSASIPGHLALDVAGTPPAAVGAAIIVSKGDAGAGDQQWDRVYQPDSDSYIFRSAGTSSWFALSVQNNSSANGAAVVQWYYEPGNIYERWTEDATSADGDYTRYRNIGTNKCLAVSGAGDGQIAPGDHVVIWTCGSGADQFWHLADS